ncbi:juvenile hormone esterase-like [Bicyclus anynana]|uniref:Carboxylic ester hydrolase n=1 Tax=Bicyclus anynana TaxID=110368 RepID=A0A6J1NCR4_BICAN|nr:juvenile hormone esterase-like [Bicyclus anynana]
MSQLVSNKISNLEYNDKVYRTIPILHHFNIQSNFPLCPDNMWVVGAVLLTLGSARGLVRLDPLVDAPAGLIRGLRADDGEYSMFLGIPYATVQEDNPFGTSIPQAKLEGVFDAFNDSAICPQVEEFGNTIVGSLDCLHLNIYVPNKATSRNRLPVLVWIYGGGFSIGFANRFLYGPKYLVRHDVILVTLNYRVGPYGFFCLDTPEIPGNQGLKDQVLALRWIKDNIQSFGGDVNKITVMGESAGGASVEYHLLSKNEKLFNQAIMQSGTTFIPGLLEDSGVDKALSIAQKLGYDTEDVAEAVEFLAKTDVKLVIAATSELGLSSRPCVEKEFENVDSMLTDYPINMDIPKAKNMPILVGFNNKERLASYASLPTEQYNLKVFEESLQKKFTYDEDFKEMEDIVRRFYIGDEEITAAVRDNLIDFDSDFDFAYPVQVSLQKYLESGAKDIYYYMFSYSGERNFVKKRLNITMSGAAHADEISYLFDISYEKEAPSEGDQLVIDRMTTLWTNFVKYGDPTPQTSDLLPVKWSPINEETYPYLDIDSELTLGARPYHQRMAFWELFTDINKERLKGYRPN